MKRVFPRPAVSSTSSETPFSGTIHDIRPAEVEFYAASKRYTRQRWDLAPCDSRKWNGSRWDEVRTAWPPPRLSSIYLNQRQRKGRTPRRARARIMRVTHNKAGTQTRPRCRGYAFATARAYMHERARLYTCTRGEGKGEREPRWLPRTTGARCSGKKYIAFISHLLWITRWYI